MKLVVNGDPFEIDDRSTLEVVIERVAESPGGKGTAVALNGEVVPRARWKTAALADGDKVEVLKAVGGG